MTVALGEAKKLGYAKRPDFRKDWESVKDGIMKKALHAKFSQHKDLLTILLSTKDAQIVEDNPDGISFLLLLDLPSVRFLLGHW
jgi:predicted NAD-dependent protein-ADP-ribosyltransferase YbiA (DUF1768 family)